MMTVKRQPTERKEREKGMWNLLIGVDDDDKRETVFIQCGCEREGNYAWNIYI